MKDNEKGRFYNKESKGIRYSLPYQQPAQHSWSTTPYRWSERLKVLATPNYLLVIASQMYLTDDSMLDCRS